MGGNLLTCDLLLFVTATFLLGMYFLPVAVTNSSKSQVSKFPPIGNRTYAGNLGAGHCDLCS